MKMRVLQVAKVDDSVQTMTVEMAIGLAWIEPRLLFNNIFDWEERRSVKTNEKLIEHLWAPNLHFLSTEKLERISTLKNSGSVTIYRNGTVQFDSHIRITVGINEDIILSAFLLALSFQERVLCLLRIIRLTSSCVGCCPWPTLTPSTRWC